MFRSICEGGMDDVEEFTQNVRLARNKRGNYNLPRVNEALIGKLRTTSTLGR